MSRKLSTSKEQKKNLPKSLTQPERREKESALVARNALKRERRELPIKTNLMDFIRRNIKTKAEKEDCFLFYIML